MCNDNSNKYTTSIYEHRTDDGKSKFKLPDTLPKQNDHDKRRRIYYDNEDESMIKKKKIVICCCLSTLPNNKQLTLTLLLRLQKQDIIFPA